MAEILEGGGLDPDKDFASGEASDDDGTSMSVDEQELRSLLDYVWDKFGPDQWTVKDLRDIAESGSMLDAHEIEDVLPSVVTTMKKDPWRSLGRYLIRHEKQFAGEKRLVKIGETRGKAVWTIENVAVV